MSVLIVRSTDDRLTYHVRDSGLAAAEIHGVVRDIGRDAEHRYRYPGGGGEGATDARTVRQAVARMTDLLDEVELSPRERPEIETVVHLFPGGARSAQAVAPLDESVLAALGADAEMPASGPAVEAFFSCRVRYPAARVFAVWDDAFFTPLPPAARTYLLPAELAVVPGIRRRGTRGLLHAEAVARVSARLRPEPRHGRPLPPLRLVLCHLERHAGVTAVQGNRPIWTTFGLAPGDGLPGTAGIGSIDIGVLEALAAAGWPIDRERLYTLRTRAGLASLGTPDDLERVAADAGRDVEPARTVFDTLVQSFVAAVGGAVTLLGGIDALVFLGEDALAGHRFRHAVCAGLGLFQVALPADDPLVPADLTLLSPPAVEPAVFAAAIDEVPVVLREVGRLTGSIPPGDNPGTPRRTLP